MKRLWFRVLWPVGLIALCVVTLCVFAAVSLFRQQETIARGLQDNVASRRAAVELEECLTDLVAQEESGDEKVGPLHVRAEAHIRTLDALAEQPEERLLLAQIDREFHVYRAMWKDAVSRKDPAEHDQKRREATQHLDREVLKPCQRLEEHSSARLEDLAAHHERVLRQLAWGMAGVGGLGGVAGVVLGFGVARGLSRSIRRLQVQVRDAAGKLSPGVPEIVLTREGDFGGLQEQIEALTPRIEAVVQELQQREHEVLRAEQLAAVGQLAAGVAHEIRNPLTSIKMLVQAGLEDAPGGLPDEDLRVIEQEVRRMERSLQTFLDFARPPKAARRPVELCAVVRAVAGLVRGRAGKQKAAVVLDVPANPITLTADRDQLQQVLVNLALNGLDAMPAGGTLTLTARRRADRRAEVEVADTGPGLDADLLPRLFQPFASTKDTGLGLGLVVSRRIVEDHGGQLSLANRPGGGASAVVVLPAEPPPDR